MNILVDYQLADLVHSKVISRGSDDLSYLINPASIDVTLGHSILVENEQECTINTWTDSSAPMYTLRDIDVVGGTYTMRPGDSILAHTRELFAIPTIIVGEYYLKSRLARCGLDHKIAGYIDPGFRGRLTLELTNTNKYTNLVLRFGQRIGQIKFTRLQFPPARPYSGQYSNTHVCPARKILVSDADPSVQL